MDCISPPKIFDRNNKHPHINSISSYSLLLHLKTKTHIDSLSLYLSRRDFTAMVSVYSITAQQFVTITKPIKETKPKFGFSIKGLSGSSLHSSCRPQKASKSDLFGGRRRRAAKDWAVGSVADELDVIPVQSSDSTDQQEGGAVVLIEREREIEGVNQVGGFTNEGRFSFDAGVAGDFQGFSSASVEKGEEEEDVEKLIDRAINATIVLAAGTFVITKLLTIDSDYWQVSNSIWGFGFFYL